MDMATRDDIGLVWMGPSDLIMTPEGSDHLFSQQTDGAYYQDSSQGLQALDDMQSQLGVDSLSSLDEIESYCREDGSRKFVTLGTAADLPPPRKIRPVKHPGLKLKTPIAYQSDTDPSVIPIQKDGMAVCQKCGAIGVKHAFYTKERRFCSLACARGSVENHHETQSSNTTIKQEHSNHQTQQNHPPQQNHQPQQNIQSQQNLQASQNITAQPIMQTTIQQNMQSPMQQQMPQIQAQMPLQTQMQMQPQVQVLMQPQMQAMQTMQQGLQTPIMAPQLQQQVQMQMQPIQTQMQQMQMAMPQMDQQMPLSMQQMQMQPQMNISQMQMQPQMQMQMQPQMQPQMQLMQSHLPMQCNPMQMQEDMHTDQQQPWASLEPKSEDSSSVASQSHPPPVMSPLPPLQLEEPLFPPDKKTCPDLLRTYEWDSHLSEPGFIAAPVSCFQHAPMSDSWDNITVGMKVEVQNTDCDNFSEDFPDSFWVATVLKISGYKALLRYEGFGQNSSKDFWVNLCSSIVHHVGWCAIRGRPLIPPKTVEHKYSDWKEFLVKRLTGARTLPSNFYNKVHESLKSRFRCHLNVEVVDKNRISQVKVASIEKIVGKRLHVRYYETDDDDNGFWCHEDSSLIHPVGWAHRVGHEIDAPQEYLERCAIQQWDDNDALEALFPQQLKQEQQYALAANSLSTSGQTGFREGMKLEAIDPLNLSSICVATIMKVLREGYIMIRIDSYDADVNCSDWFCYHQSSSCIFPVGFCQSNFITLTPPKGYDVGSFSWDAYLEQSQAIAAPSYLFKRDIPHHGYIEGMHLEATDIMDPRLVCVATVSRVVGRLLRVHFDGWEVEYDQWLDCHSPDMYPVGWCQLVAHKLEGPRIISPPKPNQGGGRTQRGVRGRRGRRGMQKRRPGMKKSPGGTLTPTQIPNMADAAVPLLSQVDSLSGEDSTGGMVSASEGIVEPVMGVEPAGPDQTLPTASEAQQLPVASTTTISNFLPVQAFATNSTNNCVSSWKVIPRLIDSSSVTSSSTEGELNPSQWDVNDVAQFLRVNDCATYCESFSRQNIDGKALLNLTKDHIMDLTGMKVGPSLKISDLIQQLRIKVNPAQERAKASLKKLL